MVEVTGRREGDRESRILLMASEALGARVRDEADAAVAITSKFGDFLKSAHQSRVSSEPAPMLQSGAIGAR